MGSNKNIKLGVVGILIMCWLSVAHSWAIQAIMPVYEPPMLVPNYEKNIHNWQQHSYDMGMNRLKEEYAKTRYELFVAFVNKDFPKNPLYWKWFSPIFVFGVLILATAFLKLSRLWSRRSVKMATKVALLAWLLWTMFPDPFRFNSPLLASILFLYLVSDGFGCDPISKRIRERVNKLGHLKKSASRYNVLILGALLVSIFYIQVRIVTGHYMPNLPLDDYEGWWKGEIFWNYTRMHVFWFARALLVVLLSVSSVRLHYLSYELANLVSFLKKEYNEGRE